MLFFLHTSLLIRIISVTYILVGWKKEGIHKLYLAIGILCTAFLIYAKHITNCIGVYYVLSPCSTLLLGQIIRNLNVSYDMYR
jgi:hypothetical protein